MTSTKKTLFICFFLLTYIVSFSQKKVACIGDSITYGSRIENREENSYPAQLQNLLGTEWLVGNFGNSGATLLKKGSKPYWNQKEFDNAKNFNPDIVIIKLGTNDSKPKNIKYKENFIKDYIDLINVFNELPSKPKIYICLPVPSFPGNSEITDKVLVKDIIPGIKKVARKTNTELIDLYKPFKKDASLFPDKIHPNKEGAGKIATLIYKVLLNY